MGAAFEVFLGYLSDWVAAHPEANGITGVFVELVQGLILALGAFVGK
ncbi:MAG: hypothetical protein LBN05_01395 [Oscillospiraceae bacterium]|jgi:hypothetical protein|nr:hypothetical protein [Oscillospiraceae bacterium]